MYVVDNGGCSLAATGGWTPQAPESSLSFSFWSIFAGFGFRSLSVVR